MARRKDVLKEWKAVEDAPTGCQFAEQGGFVWVRIPDGHGWYKDIGPARVIGGSIGGTARQLVREAISTQSSD